jgi:photosystem II stability/assembly factor-like uncharacterized protein
LISRILGLGLCPALALAPARALANGRFPAADQILVDPGDASHLVLRATYGLLQSRDGGLSWTWTCEEAVGYMGDPSVSVLAGGSVLVGFFGTVSVSAELGCGWQSQTLDASYLYPLDSTLDPADPARAWVLTVTADGTRRVSLLAIDGSGAMAEIVPVGEGFVPSTLEVAPSDPQRIYVSGAVENSPALVFRTDDGGQTWQRFTVPDYPNLPLYISAIDPADPDVLYARVDGQPDTTAPAGQRAPSDHLLVSRDGGESWQRVFSLDGDLYGFALSPDGSRVATGGPEAGVFLADTTDLDFQPVPAPVRGLRCLRWTADGLLACGQEMLDGWTVGRTRDEGQSFEAVWHQQDLQPLECAPASRTGSTCPSLWPDIALRIGADPGDVAPAVPGMLGGETGGAGGSSGTEPPPAPAADKDSGCALRWGATEWGAALTGLAALAALVLRRRQGTSM